jgi:hypothetical protein
VQQIVSAHNGTIDYKSAPGDGATFKVSLPISEKTMAGAYSTEADATIKDLQRLGLERRKQQRLPPI